MAIAAASGAKRVLARFLMDVGLPILKEVSSPRFRTQRTRETIISAPVTFIHFAYQTGDRDHINGPHYFDSRGRRNEETTYHWDRAMFHGTGSDQLCHTTAGSDPARPNEK